VCIDQVEEIIAQHKANSYCFLSDFNVYLGERTDNVCLIHALKPFVYSDGWVYACPSSELALENKRTMQESFRVCRIAEIAEHYRKPLAARTHTCSYCKYALQNNLLHALTVETGGNEFV
jgi:hypothetical protein